MTVEYKFEVGDKVRVAESYPAILTGVNEVILESDKALRGREGVVRALPDPEENKDDFYDVSLDDKYTYLLSEDELEAVG